MGHKSDTSTTSSAGHHHGHHHHHHHHHAQHRRPLKGGGGTSTTSSSSLREPSIHSMSASELSSTSSSSIHQRSTPKIAAVIIAAILVIAGLIGITVYLVDSDRFESQQSPLEEIELLKEVKVGGVVPPNVPKTGLDYKTYRDDSATVMQKFRHTSHREGKDPEGPEAAYEYYDDEEEERPASGFFGNANFNENEAADGQGVEDTTQVDQIADAPASQFHRQPYTEGLPDANGNTFQPHLNPWRQQQSAQRRQDMYEAPPHPHHYGMHHRHRGRPFYRPRQNFQRPGVQLQNSQGANLLQNAELEVGESGEPVTDAGELQDEQSTTMRGAAGGLVPPNGSRGGIHVAVPQSGEPGDSTEIPVPANMNQLSTMDRRPGRPHFHHMGPMARYNAAMRRRFQQQMFQRRLGMLQKQQQQQQQQQQQLAPSGNNPPPKNPIHMARHLLSQFEQAVKIAKSEAVVINSIARNITAEGKELNLWEMLYAVNRTLQDNPDSALGRLMTRFYKEYLVSANDSLSDAHPVKGLYEKSLSSLLFLAFGIFLLNSVNEILVYKGLDQSRAFDSDQPRLAEVLQLVPDRSTGRSLDAASGPGSLADHGSVDTFAKLVMNLMKAYQSEDDSDLECIWALYCHQLNEQAGLGGMVSSVARINSVGMKVVLKELSAAEAPRAMIQSLWKWQGLQCEKMFPNCDKRFPQTVQSEAEGDAEEEEEEMMSTTLMPDSS